MAEVFAELWRRQRWQLIGSIVAGTALAVFELLVLASLLLLLSRLGLPARDLFPLGLASYLPDWSSALLLFAAIALAQAVWSHRSARMAFDIGLEFTQSLQRELIAEFAAVPMASLRRQNSSDLSRLLSDDCARAGLAAQSAVGLAIQGLLCAVYFIGALLISPALAIGSALLVLPILLLSRRPELPLRIAALRAALKRFNESAMDFAANLPSSRAQGLMAHMGLRLTEASDQNTALQGQHHAETSRASRNQQILVVALFVLFVAAIQFTSSGAASPLLPLAVLYLRLAPRLQALQQQRILLANSASSVQAIRGQLQGHRLEPLEQSEVLVGDLQLRQLRFEYEPGHTALDLPAAEIRQGAWLAVVGASGVGKSTLLRLLTGVEAPSAGEILVDGIALQQRSLRHWQSRLAYVDQSPTFVHGSLRDNLLSHCPPSALPDDLQLGEIIEICGLQAVVEALPQGLQTLVDGSCSRLSGGQRQRLAMARAIARRPLLLLLDEATNALDEDAENTLMLAVRAYLPRATLVVISHRATSARLAEQVLVVQDAGRG